MASEPDHPGVVAPPPLLFAGALGLALAIEFGLIRVRLGLPDGLRWALAAVLIAAAALFAAALGGFRHAGTNVEPWRPSTALVTDGVYGRTRNPIYLGMTLAFLAIALAADSAVSVLALAPLLLVVQFGVIAREERYLAAKFGGAYARYTASVRRWI